MSPNVIQRLKVLSDIIKNLPSDKQQETTKRLTMAFATANITSQGEEAEREALKVVNELINELENEQQK